MQPDQLLDEQSFIDKYWHTQTEMVEVTNPTKADYLFKVTVDAKIDRSTGKPVSEQRQYMVKAGGSERFNGYVANVYLDQMSRKLAQDDNRLDRMVDFTERAKYYDQLTADTEDLIASYVENPAYKDDNSVQTVDKPAEVPFAGVKEPVTTAKAK